MATIRRLFGFKEDVEAGGTPYDKLIEGKVPDATVFWPVTGGTVDKNIERIDRNDEVRGRRAATKALPFRGRPAMTVPCAAYRSVVEIQAKKTLGGADAKSGTAPASITHSIASVDYPVTVLPAVYAQMVRDDLNHKMSGGYFNRFSWTFPLDGEGTTEIEIVGKYMKHIPDAYPTPSFTGLSEDVMMLRDAAMFIDGSATAIPDLQGFEFTFNNNTAPKWYAKKNVVTESLGTPVQTKKLWFPQENKISAAQDVTYAINQGNVDAVQELAHDFAQVQKFVFEVTGGPMATTPPASELLKVTIYAGVHTGGGGEALTARDDIVSRFEGSAFYSEADSDDVKIEIVNNIGTELK